jgi:hypothetical protein
MMGFAALYPSYKLLRAACVFSSIPSSSSCSALCRASTSLAAREDVDGWDKPGHDDEVELRANV